MKIECVYFTHEKHSLVMGLGMDIVLQYYPNDLVMHFNLYIIAFLTTKHNLWF